MAYPSKSSEIKEIEEVEAIPSVEPSDESDGSSDESETGGSESEDIDDVASKKSRDDGGKDGDGDKHATHLPMLLQLRLHLQMSPSISLASSLLTRRTRRS